MDIYESASKGTGWIKFFGIVNIIAGILEAITIIGILIAWIPIWIGITALQAASSAEKASISKSEADLIQYHSKIRFLFQLIGILIIVGIILGIIIFLVAIVASAFFASMLSELGGFNW
ncbi:MAG: DUF5362 family protein [candidate division WOR-3 bacterium]